MILFCLKISLEEQMSKHAKEQFSKGTKVDVYNNDIAKALRKLKSASLMTECCKNSVQESSTNPKAQSAVKQKKLPHAALKSKESKIFRTGKM